MGSFTINLTGLNPGAQYYVRAFATNNQGTAYGNQVVFTTEAPTAYPPTVTTTNVTEITQTSAISGGDVTDDGGAFITAKGVVWNTSSIPTLENHEGMTNDGTGSDGFVSELTELTPNTNYYLRAYAINSHGVTYGSQKVYTTLSDPALPTLITAGITDITQTSAVSGGQITNAGEGDVLLRGVCYSTSENPTVDDFFTQDGEGTGSFVSELTDLMSGATYFVRSFASSTAGGIGYGNQLSFTTLDGPPSVEILSINSGQPGFRKIDAVVVHDGGQEVTERGFVWDIEENPTLEQSEGSLVSGLGTGEYTSDFTGLTPNTYYYVRAYATNIEGTGYSEQVSFNFWDYHSTVTDIDGNVYNTVMIGDQEWITENLKTTKYRNGVPIPTGLSNIEWDGATEGAYMYPQNNAYWKDIYGIYYNWFAVDDDRGLCPYGWIIPSNDDWTVLTDYLNSINSTFIGNQLKSCHQVNSPIGGDCNTSEHPRWPSDNTHYGTDEYGFSAYPAGTRYTGGSFTHIKSTAWWSSTESSDNSARMRDLYHHVRNYTSRKTSGFSIRCIREATEPTLFNLQLDVSPEGAGTVAGAGENVEGEEVFINATANPGWGFVEWTGDIDNIGDLTSASITITMPADDITLTAIFEYIPDLPNATTLAASDITATSAVLNALVNPNHLETTVIFEWGLTNEYGNIIVAEQSPIDGSTNISVSALIDGLVAENTYYFRVVAENDHGVAYGAQKQFSIFGGNIMIIHDVIADPGDVILVEMEVVNNDLFYNFQLDIPIPDGFSYVPGSIALNPFRANGHTIIAHVRQDNSLRIFSYHVGGNHFLGNDGVVASFSFETSDVSGSYPLNILNAGIGANFVNILTGTQDGTVYLEDDELEHFTLEIEIVGQGSVSINGVEYTEPLVLDAGTYNFLSATAETGWLFSGWSGDLTGHQNPVSMLMTSDKFITATFSEPNTTQYIFGIEVIGSGNIKVDGADYSGPMSVSEGTTLNLLAEPDHGWQFHNWTGDTDYVDDVDSEQTTVTMPAESISLTANFQEEIEPTLFSLYLEVNPEDSGTVSGEGEYEEGELVEINAIAEEGWEFVEWALEDETFVSDEPFNTIEITGDLMLVAHFDKLNYMLTLIASPEVGGSVVDVTDGAPYNIGDEVQIKAEANEGWDFTEWTGDYAGNLDDLAAAETIFTMPADNVELTANFQEREYPFYGDGVTDIDGNDYVTVIIGDQEWMAENLKTTKYRNGVAITYPGSNHSEWFSNTNGAYAWYNHDISWKDIYGAYYNWYALNNENGLCPDDWHVPNNEDYDNLFDYLGGNSVAGGKLKSTRTAPESHPRWNTPNTGATDEYGFAAIPGTLRGSSSGNGFYDALGRFGVYWSKSESPLRYWLMRNDGQHVGLIASPSKGVGASVRCIKDIE